MGLNLFAIIVCSFIVHRSWSYYRILGQRNLLYFGWAFLLMGLSVLFKSIYGLHIWLTLTSYLLIYLTVRRQSAFDTTIWYILLLFGVIAWLHPNPFIFFGLNGLMLAYICFKYIQKLLLSFHPNLIVTLFAFFGLMVSQLIFIVGSYKIGNLVQLIGFALILIVVLRSERGANVTAGQF